MQIDNMGKTEIELSSSGRSVTMANVVTFQLLCSVTKMLFE